MSFSNLYIWKQFTIFGFTVCMKHDAFMAIDHACVVFSFKFRVIDSSRFNLHWVAKVLKKLLSEKQNLTEFVKAFMNYNG